MPPKENKPKSRSTVDKNVTYRQTLPPSDTNNSDNNAAIAIAKVIGNLNSVSNSMSNPLFDKDAAIKQLKTMAILLTSEVLPRFNSISATELEHQRSVVISGLPEMAGRLREMVSHDREQVFNVIEDLSIEAIPAHVYRLDIKKPDQKSPRFLKVVFCTRAMQRTVIQKAKELRKSETHKNVFIRPSLTYEDQQKQRQLLEDLKKKREAGERVKIHKNQIVKVDESGNIFH
jgi:uncharacterized membrane protein